LWIVKNMFILFIFKKIPTLSVLSSFHSF